MPCSSTATLTVAPRRRHRRLERCALCTLLGVLLLGVLGSCGRNASSTPNGQAPATLQATGLFADEANGVVAPDVLPFSPKYPLWTDGAHKRRWIALPAGSAIDVDDIDDWQFPTGTRLWKEFTFAAGVETRYLERQADGSWLYATYVRNAAEPIARLAPAAGMRNFVPTRDGRHHDVPSVADCRVCHENGMTPVLGFAALQLGDTLPDFAQRGLFRNLPTAFAASPPRIEAASATARDALGYLHGNCGNCHHARGPLHRLGLRLDYPIGEPFAVPPAIATTVGVASRFQLAATPHRITAGDPSASLLYRRVTSDHSALQMPPLGRHVVDPRARELLDAWIRNDLSAPSPDHQTRTSAAAISRD